MLLTFGAFLYVVFASNKLPHASSTTMLVFLVVVVIAVVVSVVFVIAYVIVVVEKHPSCPVLHITFTTLSCKS